MHSDTLSALDASLPECVHPTVVLSNINSKSAITACKAFCSYVLSPLMMNEHQLDLSWAQLLKGLSVQLEMQV